MKLQSKFLKFPYDDVVRKKSEVSFSAERSCIVPDCVCQTLYQTCDIDEYKEYNLF